MSLPRHLPPAEPDSRLLCLFEKAEGVPAAVRRQAGFFVFFAKTVFPLIESYRERLETAYCKEDGRPAWDPVRMMAVLILQFVLRMPDRQAAESAQYDQRWRLALHMNEEDTAFDPSLLVVFRNRLLRSGQESLAFEAILGCLVKQGWVPKRSRQRLDSTHVWGLLREMNRLECARETIRLWLVDIEAIGLFPETWAVYWERYVENKIDPRAGRKTLEGKSLETGGDMLAIWKDVSDIWPIASRNSFVLMQRVFLENYEFAPDGRTQATRAQPTGAVNNPHEPEAQWSSKSSTQDKHWVGYKVQVAETAQEQPRQTGEPTANFLTCIVTQDAPDSDKTGMTHVFEEQRDMGLDAPSPLYVDGAYVSSEALQQAEVEDRELRGPAPASPDRGKVFTVEAFDVHTEERYAICPAGQRSTNCSHVEESRGRIIFRIEWNKKLCGDCQKYAACVSGSQGHRTICVNHLHSYLQFRRREMQTEAFKLEMRLRNGIEGTQSELVRGYGLRQARYRGQAKVRLQNYVIGAACNIRRLFRRIDWLMLQALKATGKAVVAVPT